LHFTPIFYSWNDVMKTPVIRDRRGFTLIELLVVIAIISLLVSILLPSLQKAKELAKGAVCLSNLKNCGLSQSLYAQVFDGVMFVSWYYKGYASNPNQIKSFTWTHALGGFPVDDTSDLRSPYIEDYNITVCPSEAPYRWNRVNPDNTPNEGRFQRIYAGFLLYPWDIEDWKIDGVYLPGDGDPEARGCLIQTNDLKKSSDFPLVMDSYTCGVWSSQTYIVWPRPRHPDHEAGPDMRHGNRAHIVFPDGHAEACDGPRMRGMHIESAYDQDKVIVPLSY
jgi:prepilin-type N-terminal cleavage/methylation domain-containing protein/prepilin-type processing-associated H-X9-DG protein